MKKIITILMASLMMLTPSLSTARHDDNETLIRNLFQAPLNSTSVLWSSGDVSSQNIPVARGIVQNVEVRTTIGQDYQSGVVQNLPRSSPMKHDRFELDLLMIITLTDGTQKILNITNNIDGGFNRPDLLNHSFVGIDQSTGHISAIVTWHNLFDSSGRNIGYILFRIDYNNPTQAVLAYRIFSNPPNNVGPITVDLIKQ